uniref:DUF4817 domain-containing protein n=1 Tax=Strigamia maritima TaxID=126957 RepID=T1IMH5_STRMM
MAPHTFTNEIFVELLLLYFRNGENQSKASQLYAELHPDQPAPSHKVVGRLIKRFLATGSVQEIKRGRPKSATAENNTIDVPASVEVEPKLSVRLHAQARERYRDLLNNQVWPVLEPLLDANADMNPHFMQDGAPPHFSRIARQWLDEKFPVYPASTIQELEASIIRNTQNISRDTLVSIRQAWSLKNCQRNSSQEIK